MHQRVSHWRLAGGVSDRRGSRGLRGSVEAQSVTICAVRPRRLGGRVRLRPRRALADAGNGRGGAAPRRERVCLRHELRRGPDHRRRGPRTLGEAACSVPTEGRGVASDDVVLAGLDPVLREELSRPAAARQHGQVSDANGRGADEAVLGAETQLRPEERRLGRRHAVRRQETRGRPPGVCLESRPRRRLGADDARVRRALADARHRPDQVRPAQLVRRLRPALRHRVGRRLGVWRDGRRHGSCHTNGLRDRHGPRSAV
mmetsp:Transcript_25778/g.79300  ORF Transcript_25778/g.79300 Transcript_25778/m.79300 type:complete len:259 (+) Transcript_25778:345-1121(+)